MAIVAFNFPVLIAMVFFVSNNLFALAEKVRYNKALEDYEKALAEYNRKCIQLSTAPAC